MRAQARIFAALVAVPVTFIASGANNAETAVPKRGDLGNTFLRPPQKERNVVDAFVLPPWKERDAGKMFLRSPQNERKAENMYVLPPQSDRDAGRYSREIFLRPTQQN